MHTHTLQVYPICTIRSTPDQPVHCIVWAKEFFKLLFGKPSESMLFEAADSFDRPDYMNYVDLQVRCLLSPLYFSSMFPPLLP